MTTTTTAKATKRDNYKKQQHKQKDIKKTPDDGRLNVCQALSYFIAGVFVYLGVQFLRKLIVRKYLVHKKLK
jgi:hypothetical protein